MISNTYTDKLLDEYLKGSISHEQLTAEIKQMGADDAQPLIAEHLTAIAAVKQYNLSLQVQQVHAQFVQQPKQETTPTKVIRMSPAKLMMRVAATVVLILSATLGYQYITSTSADFYSNLHQSYTVSEVRGNEGVQSSEIIQAYKNADYVKTIQLFTNMQNPGNRDLFFAGNSYLETGNTAKAIELLNTILVRNQTGNEKLYQDEAEYYLAMAYLKNNNTEKALPLLTIIADDTDHTYHHKVDRWTVRKMKWFGH